MAEVLEIFLAEPSFLVREGLKTLLSQMGFAFRIEETDAAVNNLQKILSRSKPKLVFINPELLPGNFSFNRSREEFNQVVLIALCKNPPNHQTAAQFDFTMHAFLSRSELVNQINFILNKAGWPTNENDNSVLSERETELLRLVALGMTNNEISERLFISVHTVMTHRKNITRKLGIKTVSGLTVYAILNKLIKAEEVKGSL